MNQEDKSKVDDLIKLRRILDNPSDPALESLLVKKERTLESVRRRIQGGYSTITSQSGDFFPRISSMEPRVFVHEITPFVPCSTTTAPINTPSAPLPEFEYISTVTPKQQLSPQKLSFISEELFEVEKVDQIIPEFLEVNLDETNALPSEQCPRTDNDGASEDQTSLPEWQPVEEKKESESFEAQMSQNLEDIPEFERVDGPSTVENLEEQLKNEPVSDRQDPRMTPVDFLLVEPSKLSGQTISKKQTHEARSGKRTEEKAAKRFQKMKLKRIKKQQQKEKQDGEKTIHEQPALSHQPKTPTEFESSKPVHTPGFSVDMAAYNAVACIDEKTAELLYTHGYFSIENIKDATLDDLVQIRGIRRKLAKQIKKEIQQIPTITASSEFVPIVQKNTKRKSPKKLQDAGEWESLPTKEPLKPASSPVCVYNEYTLFKRETTTRDRKKTTIHFFSRQEPENGQPSTLPDGYQIAVNKKTGVPYLKRKN